MGEEWGSELKVLYDTTGIKSFWSAWLQVANDEGKEDSG